MSGTLAAGKTKWGILLAVTAIVLVAAGIYAVGAYQRFEESRTAASSVGVTAGQPLPGVPFVLFRNTASGQGYGNAATVPLSAPSGTRAVSDQECDRVYGTHETVVCLKTNRGLVTAFEAAVLNSDWQQQRTWPVPGIPSRTRISPDGSMIATTVFVTGHSYATAGFSTATEITLPGGTSGNLEDFALMVNGERLVSTDRNIWGVTFAPGQSDVFYATAASSGRIWLVRGSLSARTLTAMHDNVECPSISPDGTRIAFKKNDGGALAAHWKVAVLDLATGQETVLSEKRSVDDQIEWLDDHNLLYGLADEAVEGDSNIWKLGTEAASQPSLFIAHAWSPSVVR
ncbi:WD40-like Beta Propeller Repeat [Arthrobacter sp. yr096]|uniref:TolB family protein n=1 Tax=Arthrobacter sp. yr096 TaxID=1761750 RepID=UPI0008D63D1D|nr:PD40 domain-containing protein [Arthrobacter sp. yr096]SEI57990.1 WD40-like Beta Propeller Repeat [Arthrobacter sp. yr096]